VLGLGDHPALSAPAVQRAPGEVGEAADGTALGQTLQLGRGQVVGDGADQALVARQAEDIIDGVGFAPRHDLVAGKARISAQQDLDPGPTGADLADDAGHFLLGAGGRIDVRASELGRQQVPSAEHDSGR
jgi:hypothetical protein